MLLSVEPDSIEIIIQLPPWILHVIPHNFVALSIEVQGTPNKFLWSSKVFHENVMEFHGTFMEFHRVGWNSMEVYQHSMKLHGLYMEFHGVPWNSMGLFYTGMWYVQLKY